METLITSCRTAGYCIYILALLIGTGLYSGVSASPSDWMYSIEEEVHAANETHNLNASTKGVKEEVSLALSCKANVNVSLGEEGYAILTAIMLVNAPAYPAFQYDVDIMGPLNDTAFCAQIGQELMVMVTEIPTGNACMSIVLIQDKMRPVLICTPDTLPCNTDIATINFEDFIEATDNCDDDLSFTFQYAVQNLPCNPSGLTQQIAVLVTATDDSGNNTSCQNIIYLQQPPLSQIEFPDDVTVNCVNANIDPAVTGVPTFNGQPIGSACGYMVTYTDQVVPMCMGAQKILRMWRVMNVCTGAQRTEVQEIIIIDNVPPVITCPASLIVGTDPGVCTTKYTLPFPAVSDACAPQNMIDIDIFVSGVPGIFSPGQMVNLGLGVTLITIRATDPCGNSAQCMYNVTVRDNTPPIPICHSLVVTLGANGMATLMAANLTFPVIENCGILSKQIFRMTNTCNVPEDLLPGPDVKFCCADAGDTLMIGFKVTDLSGNMNTCMFQVIVKDLMPPVAVCDDITISITNEGTIVVDPDLIDGGSTDNCSIVDLTLLPGSFDCEDIGENDVVLVVTDQSGNSATCTATVTVVDLVPPVAVCQDITITVDANGNASITPAQIDNGSSDNCFIDTIYLNQTAFDCTDEGINIVTLTVEDESGNSDQCTATVTVLTSPPVAICQDITVSLNSAGTVTITGAQVDDGSFDDCDDVSFSVTPSTFTCDNLGDNIVTLTVSDDAGNTDTCTAVVTVVDDIPPVALCQDITIMLDSNGMATITASQINNGSFDNCEIISITVTPTMFDCDDAGNNPVTLIVTDQSNNSDTCIANVMVLMPDPPTAICQNITVTIGPGGIVVITPEDIDNGSFAQCGDVTLQIDQDTFDCDDLGANIVILTVTDATGATATCVSIVTVLDAPPIAVCENITVSLDANGNVVINGIDIAGNSTDDCSSGLLEFTVTPSSFDCDDIGTNVVTVTVTDESDNTSTCTAIVTVEDNTAPTAICQDITVELDSNGIVIITGVLINNNSTDNCDSLELIFTVDPDTLDCDDLGETPVILIVTDQSGNSSTCVSIVTIEGLPPVADCQNITVSLGPNGVVVIDPEDVDGGSSSICGGFDLSLDEDTFDCTEIGPNQVTLTVTDDSGSTATCTAIVTVVDDMDPICTANDLTVYVNSAGIVVITPDQIDNGSTDNCDSIDLTITPDDFTCLDLGPNTVTLTVTDDAGNSSTCTATVTVLDTISPVCIAQDITVSINGSGVVIVLPGQVNNGSFDNCGSVLLELIPNTFDCDDIGDNPVVLIVTDPSGNSSACEATVTVDEGSGALEANCQNITIFLDSNGNAFVDPEDVNNGSGGGCGMDSLEFDLDQTLFTCADIGPNIVILTVTDQDGNTATCTAIITVVDNLPPTITCPPNLTVECDEVSNPANTAQFGSATASDNCPGVSMSESAVFNLNDCNVGSITRTFTATDASGNTSQCVQVITFINTNPFTEDDIDWPPSPITVNVCNSTDPEDLIDGEPEFDPASLQCANPMASFVDQVQIIIDNDPNTPCRIITRTWTVTDNCQPGVSFVFVQTINVIDTASPVIPNINNMTKVANANCVAFFTIIASATDCAGVTITNNSPYGATTGANASGNYPIGETLVIFTATDGCGNTSTMDVLITVTDPNPTEFLCEKVIIILPEETEIELCAEIFITFLPGGCTTSDDFIISYSNVNPFDTCRIYDCGDVGVTTFSLYFYNLAGTELMDSCTTADLDLRDPDDNCMDGLVLIGDVDNEEGLAVIGVNVNITNAPMLPGTTDDEGEYLIGGLNEGVGYEVAPWDDENHREGVSTLDLVLIQKHLLGRAKLGSPYKLIAADANKSGHITALDLLEIRKLILGIYNRFPNNTSWRFIDRNYSFPDWNNPFGQPFPESIWIDSVTIATSTADFVGIKIGDVNGSFFKVQGGLIEQRSGAYYEIELREVMSTDGLNRSVELVAPANRLIDGMQFSVTTGGLTDEQIKTISSDVLSSDQWYYDVTTETINVSWNAADGLDLGAKNILKWSVSEFNSDDYDINARNIKPEVYRADDESVETAKVIISRDEFYYSGESNEYHLYQNKPNPFVEGTTISFTLPQSEEVLLVIHDLTGRQIFEHKGVYTAGRSEVVIKGTDLKTAGIYYYTIYTGSASLTRKMSFTNN